MRRAGAVIAAMVLATVGATAQTPPDAGLSVRALDRVDIMAIATLTPQEGALPRSLWRGVGGAEARRLMLLAPHDGPSLSAARLVSRVLQSGGDAPEGAADRRELGLARLNALYDGGHVEAVARILSSASGALSEPAYAQLAAQARFLSGDAAGACRLVQQTRAPQAVTFWARARAACFAMAGELAAAELTLSAARDFGGDYVDATFDAWTARAAGPTAAPARQPRDAVEVALALHARGPLNSKAVGNLPLAAAAAVARHDNAPSMARLAAVRRAARADIVDARALAAAYDAAPPPGNVTNSVGLLAAAQKAEGERAHALAYQAVATAPDPGQRAEALAAALDLTGDARDFILAAHLYSDAIGAAPLVREVLVYAPILAEAAAAAGDPARARALLDAQAAPPGSPAALIAVDDADAPQPLTDEERASLEVLIAAADSAASGEQLGAAALRRLQSAETLTEGERARAQTDAFLLLALGAANTPQLRAAAEAAASAAPPLPDEARGALIAMDAAADADAMAEVVLYAARVLDTAGPGHPVAAARVARALWRVGLGEGAHQVVSEAILVSRRGAPAVLDPAP